MWGFHILPGENRASLGSQTSNRFCTRLGYLLSFKTQTCSEFHLFAPSDNKNWALLLNCFGCDVAGRRLGWEVGHVPLLGVVVEEPGAGSSAGAAGGSLQCVPWAVPTPRRCQQQARSCGWLLVAVGCCLWHDARADAGGSLSRTLGCGGDHKKTEQEPECGHKPAALVLAGHWPCWAAGDAVRARVGVLVSLPSSNQRDTLWPVVLTSTATLQVCTEHQMASREFNLRVRLHLKQFPFVLCFSPRQLICWG